MIKNRIAKLIGLKSILSIMVVTVTSHMAVTKVIDAGAYLVLASMIIKNYFDKDKKEE